MWPFLRDGDVVTLAPFCGPVRLGEVLAARRGEELLLHRVVRLSAKGPVLRGDALPREDGAFAAPQLLGRVVRLRRSGRERAPSRLFALAAAPACRLFLRAVRRSRACAPARACAETTALR